MVAIRMTDYYGIDLTRIIIIVLDVLNNFVSCILKSPISDVDSLNITDGISKWYGISTLFRFYIKEIDFKKNLTCSTLAPFFARSLRVGRHIGSVFYKRTKTVPKTLLKK